jgi:type III restriction enzyme
MEPPVEPTRVWVQAPTGQMGHIAAVSDDVEHDREQFHTTRRLQSSEFSIVATILRDMHEHANRQQLFPQVLKFVREYIQTRVKKSDETPIEDIALTRYKTVIAERVREALRDETVIDKPPILPVLDTYRPIGTTADVIFTTTRQVWKTKRSHVSHVVLESQWEKRAAQILEDSRHVLWYVRNYKLDFAIPYRFAESSHQYIPDFIVVLVKDPNDPESPRLNLVLEIKGMEDEQDRQKAAGARRWVDAVNYAGSYGRWWYEVCKDVDSLRSKIEEVVNVRMVSHAMTTTEEE